MKPEEYQQLEAQRIAEKVKQDIYLAINGLQNLTGVIRLGNGRHRREMLQRQLDDAQTTAEELLRELTVR